LVSSPEYRSGDTTDGVRKEWLTKALNGYKDYMRGTTFLKSSRIQNEKYVRDLYNIYNDARHTEVNPEDPDYVKSVLREKEKISVDNPVIMKEFKETYGYEKK